MKHLRILPTSTLASLFLLVLVTIFAIGNFVFGYTEPNANPPAGNVVAPLNMGITRQVKPGELGSSVGLIVSSPTLGQPDFKLQNVAGTIYFKCTDANRSECANDINNGASRFNIGQDGNVGIGTTTPDGTLDVMKTISGLTTGLRFSSWHFPGITAGGIIDSYDDGGTVRYLVLQNNGGNVGIGTTSPGAKLTVADGSINVTTPSYSVSTLNLSARDVSTTNDETLYLNFGNGSGNVQIGGESEMKQFSVTGDVQLWGRHALRGNDSWLRLNQDGAFVSGVHTPALFTSGSLNVGGAGGWGNPGSGNVWITGNVGIGTTSPVAKLDVVYDSNNPGDSRALLGDNDTGVWGGSGIPGGTGVAGTASNTGGIGVKGQGLNNISGIGVQGYGGAFGGDFSVLNTSASYNLRLKAKNWGNQYAYIYSILRTDVLFSTPGNANCDPGDTKLHSRNLGNITGSGNSEFVLLCAH